GVGRAGSGVVGVAGRGVVLLLGAVGAVGRRGQTAGPAVEVRDGRDSQDLGVGRRRRLRQVAPVVAGGGDDGHAGGVHLADGGVEGVLVAGAAVVVASALAAEAHVDDLDVVGGGVLRHPVEAADDVGDVTRAVGAEDPHGVDRSAGRDADHAGDALVGHDAGDVGAVPVEVGRDAVGVTVGGGLFRGAEDAEQASARRRSAVVAADHVEVGSGLHAGVEEGNRGLPGRSGGGAGVGGHVAVWVQGRGGADALDAGVHRRHVRARAVGGVEHVDGPVGGHVGDPGVVAQGIEL